MQDSLPYKVRARDALLRLGVPAALAAVTLVALRAFNPASTWFFPPCPFHVLTGYLCPGCGTTRALHQLLNGHLAAAFRLNPLTMVLLPYVGYSAASALSESACGRPFPRLFLRPVYIRTLLAVVILFWILRNIPGFQL